MDERPCHVLFLCTHNSARSILAESILTRLGGGRFKAFSAGSHPGGQVNPEALALLRRLGYETAHLRSKSWDEFAGPEAPSIDIVTTVCDAAAGEACPVWPGRPVSAHWPFPDPSGFIGSAAERRAVMAELYGQIQRRIELLAALPLASLDRLALKQRLDALGRDPVEPA